jgi:hypothetical protein
VDIRVAKAKTEELIHLSVDKFNPGVLSQVSRSPLTVNSDHSAAIYTFAAWRRLSDDDARLKLEVMPIRQNTDVEVRIAQFDLHCLVIQSYDHGDGCLWRAVRVVRALLIWQATLGRLQAAL